MGKIRCNDSARARRSGENEALGQLSDMLPVDDSKKQTLHKTTVVRLTAAYLQLKEFSKGFQGEGGTDEHKEGCSLEELGTHLLQCSDGFLLVVGLNGKTIYVSETVTSYLGLSQIEMTGELIYGYMHPEDKSELESFLFRYVDQPSQHRIEDDTKLPVKFTFRMKCTLSKRQCGFVVGGYKIIHCSGYLKFGVDVSSQNGSDPVVGGGNRTRRRPGSGLILICQSLPWSVKTAIRLCSRMFTFRLGLDFTIYNADIEGLTLTGYEPGHLHGKKLYSFLHPLHLFQIQSDHTMLLKKGQVMTPYYAFLKNGGGWIWMQSYFVRTKFGKPPRDCIVACNYVLSERQHVNQVIAEEQSCPLNSSQYNKRSTSASNRAISKKRSNNIFKCCFTSTAGSRDANTFPSGKMEQFSKKADILKRTKQNQSRVPLLQSNYQDSMQSSNLTIPLSNTGTPGQLLVQFCDRTICGPIYKWNNDQSLMMPDMNALQKIPPISKTRGPLEIFHQMHDGKVVNVSNGKASNLQNCLIPSKPKEQNYFDIQKSYLNPTSLSTSGRGNNETSPLVVSKWDEDIILNPVLNKEYPFLEKPADTVKVSFATEISQKPASILKTLLSKSPNVSYPSTSTKPHFSFVNNRTLSYHKEQFKFPTFSKLNLDIPLAENTSCELNQPKILSPVSETALVFNCLQIQPATHCEPGSSKELMYTYSKEFPSTSTCIRSNIRRMPPDFSCANPKRVRSYYDCTKTIDSVVPSKERQMEINRNYLHCSKSECYDYSLGNTVAGYRTKDYGRLEDGIKTSAGGGILEKENLIYENESLVNPLQTYESKSLFHSYVSRSNWNSDKNYQHQYSERKILSLKQELERSHINKNSQYLCSETKVLSSSLELGRSNFDKYCKKIESKFISSSRESDRSDINKYFQDRSLETKVLFTSLESYRSNIDKYVQDHSLERKVLPTSLESYRSNIGKYVQDHSLERKVRSTSLESYRSNSDKYVQDHSLERKVLRSSNESCGSDINNYIQDQSTNRTEIKNCQFQSSERKVQSPSFESTYCRDYNDSPTSFLNDLNNNDFSDITNLHVDSEPESLYSSITVENTSQLVSGLPNALRSTLQPNTSSQRLLEQILHS